MRVSSGGLYYRMRVNVSKAAERVGDTTDRLASGKQVARASDAPTYASAILRLDSTAVANEAYRSNSLDASNWLSAADASLADATTIIQRTKTLGEMGINGSTSADDRKAYADEIDALIKEMAGAVNVTHLGHAIFAGHGAAVVSQDPTTGAYSYVGESGQVLRQLDADTTIDVSNDGSQIFGLSPTGDSIFSVMQSLSDAVRSGDATAIGNAVQRLNARQDAVLTAAESVGTRTNMLESVSKRLSSLMIHNDTVRSSYQDVDIAKATLDAQAAKTSFEAALAAAGQANLPSLASFLR